MKNVSVKGCKLFYHEAGNPEAPCFLWAHGWGQNHKAFLKLLQPFEKQYRHILIDFPGFGESPEPPETWGTEEYADLIAAFIEQENLGPVFWVGHSFGCRVGLHMASKYPALLVGQAYISGAGIRLPKPFLKSLYFKGRIALYKFLKKLTPFGLSEEWLKTKFGSSDYKSASGIMRQLFVKVVNEDLVEQAQNSQTPTILLYGEDDTATPPAMGRKLETLMPDAEFIALEGQDHYTVLDSGRHQVVSHLNRFIRSLDFVTK